MQVDLKNYKSLFYLSLACKLQMSLQILSASQVELWSITKYATNYSRMLQIVWFLSLFGLQTKGPSLAPSLPPFFTIRPSLLSKTKHAKHNRKTYLTNHLIFEFVCSTLLPLIVHSWQPLMGRSCCIYHTCRLFKNNPKPLKHQVKESFEQAILKVTWNKINQDNYHFQANENQANVNQEISKRINKSIQSKHDSEQFQNSKFGQTSDLWCSRLIQD